MSILRTAFVTLLAMALLVVMAAAPGRSAQSSAPNLSIEGSGVPTSLRAQGVESASYFHAVAIAMPQTVRVESIVPRRTTTLFPAVRARARFAPPEFVLAQLPEVAAMRGLDEAVLIELVHRHTERTPLGPLSRPAVNIPMLNLALDAMP